MKHEKDSQKYPGILNKRKIIKNSKEDLFLQKYLFNVFTCSTKAMFSFKVTIPKKTLC